MVYFCAAVPSSGLYFTLNGIVYLPGDTVLISDVGDSYYRADPGRSIVCVTSNVNTQCCRGVDGGNLGEWYFPNGTIVPRDSGNYGADFTRRGFTHQVRLNRRNINAIAPTGSYECIVPDGNGVDHTARIRVITAAGKRLGVTGGGGGGGGGIAKCVGPGTLTH